MFEAWLQEIQSIADGWKYGDFSPKSPLADHAEGKFIEIGDGVKIYVEDTGGTGEVLFFLYGLGCAISHWKHQIKYFAQKSSPCTKEPAKRRFRIVWMDFRGHGQSTSATSKTSDFSLATFVEDIASVFKQLKITQATVLGQSMGGTIAISFACKYPHLVTALVLQGSPPQSPSKMFNISKLGAFSWKAMIELNRQSPFAVRLLHRSLPAIGRPMMEVIRIVGFNAQLVSIEDVTEYTEALLASNPNVFWELAADLEKFDIARLPQPVTVRTLIIAGRKDNCVSPEAIHYLASHLPQAQLVFVEHGSHCPHLDDPPLVNELIDRFIEQGSP